MRRTDGKKAVNKSETNGKEKPKPKGTKQIRQEKCGGKLFWGYHVWLRQPDGSRKQVRTSDLPPRTRLKKRYVQAKLPAGKNDTV